MNVPARLPKIVRILGPGLLFRVKTRQKEVYLTFDDGPVDGLTPWILDCLSGFGAKATFFLVGENAKRRPDLVSDIIARGHSIGNHTHNHLNGFVTRQATYLENFRQCAAELSPHITDSQNLLFRPPYGRILPGQAYHIRKCGYQVVMWDVLSKDYDPAVTPQEVEANVLDHIRPGSIIVMHDNPKAETNVRTALPGILSGIQAAGYRFGIL